MEIIEIQTLIDITNTRVTRPNQGTQLEVDQQRNFVTLTQCLEIRSIVFYDSKPVVNQVDVKGLGFGTAYKGKQNVWTFVFSTDRDGVYMDDAGDPIGALLEDLHEVPIIKNLSETINIEKAFFDCKDTRYKNTIIKSLPNNTI